MDIPAGNESCRTEHYSSPPSSSHELQSDFLTMDKNPDHVTEKILKLTLEIIYLLTGEDYGPVKNHILNDTTSNSSRNSERLCRTWGLKTAHSPSQKNERNNNKILDLTNQMIELLNREVLVRCQDVTVYFSMEEWEYIERHKGLYKDIIMEDRSLDRRKALNSEDTEVEEEQGLPSPPSIHNNANDIQAKASARKISKWRKPRKRRTRYISKHKLKNTSKDDRPRENSDINNGFPRNEVGKFTLDGTNSDTNTLNSCSPSEIKPDNENYTPNDNTQGKYISGQTEQQESCTEENSTGDNVDIKPSSPDFSSCIREPPVDTLTAPCYTQEQYAYTPIKKETVPTEAENYEPEPSKYPSTPDQEESWQKANDIGANIYAMELNQYTLAHIKEEAVFCEKESENAFTYIPPEDMQAQHTPKQVKVEPISHEQGYELYIPTDCSQRLHISAPGQVMNRVQDAAKTNKGFSVTKYRDWNESPDNMPRINHRTPLVVDGMYVCATCEKSFTSHFGLVKHQAMHNGSKVSCPQCGKLFFYKSSLVIHQRIHTGEKLFTCPVCNKCFTNNSNLVVHQRIHTGEKPFVCSECGKRFGHKGHLNRHLRTHESERPATNIENYVHSNVHDHWNAHKINGWSHNIYNAGPYSTYDKSV